MLFEETFLIPQFLNQYGPNAGDVVVLYDVTGRKVYFWKHKDSDSDWELLFPPRGYRKKACSCQRVRYSIANQQGWVRLDWG